MDLVLFFGPEGERQQQRERRERAAKAVYARCPARVECLEYALEHDERFGIWGGLSERERRKLKRHAAA